MTNVTLSDSSTIPRPLCRFLDGNTSHRLLQDVVHSLGITEPRPQHVPCEVTWETLGKFQAVNRRVLDCHGCLTHVMRPQGAKRSCNHVMRDRRLTGDGEAVIGGTALHRLRPCRG